MKNIKVLLFSIFLFFLVSAQNQLKTQIHIIIEEFAAELTQWVGFNMSAVEVAQQCELKKAQKQLLTFHDKLTKIGESFTKQHLLLIKNVLSEQQPIRNFFICILNKRTTSNQFFQQKKRFKHLNKFINQHPQFAQEAFRNGDKPFDKGYRLGRFFKSFFEYYYLYVLNPSETISTTLIRTITVKSDIFNHEDISSCIALQTSGKISDNLQDLSIQNIYIKIPAAFDALKYIKIKDKCRSEKYTKITNQMSQRLKNIDMFKIMYSQYAPFVEIAAEKYGTKQVQRIGQIFANIINNPSLYQKYSAEQL